MSYFLKSSISVNIVLFTKQTISDGLKPASPSEQNRWGRDVTSDEQSIVFEFLKRVPTFRQHTQFARLPHLRNKNMSYFFEQNNRTILTLLQEPNKNTFEVFLATERRKHEF